MRTEDAGAKEWTFQPAIITGGVTQRLPLFVRLFSFIHEFCHKSECRPYLSYESLILDITNDTNTVGTKLR